MEEFCMDISKFVKKHKTGKRAPFWIKCIDPSDQLKFNRFLTDGQLTWIGSYDVDDPSISSELIISLLLFGDKFIINFGAEKISGPLFLQELEVQYAKHNKLEFKKAREKIKEGILS